MFELCEATVSSVQKAFADGSLTSLELTMQYLERIADIDQSGPLINSVLEVNPDALDMAEALDREYAQKGPRGPLHGIPVLLKDNINTADKLHTSAGTLALKDNFAPQDAFIVEKLRAAGAVILGKANMTELANYMSDHMRNGFSSRGGAVLNPYGADLNVGGSSAGSGAAVSANLCTVAVGTETSGSILCPANYNSIVGIKPTKGLVSRTGIIPICTAQDTAGPLARTVADAAQLLTVLAGTDPKDPATGAIEPYLTDYAKFATPDGLKGMRIGLSRTDEARYKPEFVALAEYAWEVLAHSGAEIVPVDMGRLSRGWQSNILLYEFKRCLNAYLASCTDPGAKSLLEIIEYNNKDPQRCLQYGQKTLLDAQLCTSGNLTEPVYLHERADDLRRSRKAVDDCLKEHGLDCIVMLGWNDVPPLSGYPAVSIPAGRGAESGQPMGITFVGTAFSEPVLIRAAAGMEAALNGRIPPML
ncbi:MAG: amidase [Firmicutes bacterium]|nr:amidase [Bacillota bacterium]